jgi:hypothetical protein
MCDNSPNAIGVVDVEVGGFSLKGIQCNNCGHYFGFFQDTLSRIEEIKERLDSLESDVDDF